MASPYSTGGGGTHFEARVVASCVSAVLCEGSVRGLPGEFATAVLTQRAAFGDPLDHNLDSEDASQEVTELRRNGLPASGVCSLDSRGSPPRSAVLSSRSALRIVYTRTV